MGTLVEKSATKAIAAELLRLSPTPLLTSAYAGRL